jgi:hypothetical protein
MLMADMFAPGWQWQWHLSGALLPGHGQYCTADDCEAMHMYATSYHTYNRARERACSLHGAGLLPGNNG